MGGLGEDTVCGSPKVVEFTPDRGAFGNFMIQLSVIAEEVPLYPGLVTPEMYIFKILPILCYLFFVIVIFLFLKLLLYLKWLPLGNAG